jgi:ribonuclease-3
MAVFSLEQLRPLFQNTINPKNLSLYQCAFVHKSAIKYLRRHQTDIESNERLEFLGDSVLNMVVASWLYALFPLKDEGFLTKLRIKMINGKTLSFLAQELNIDSFIVISPNTIINDKIREDVFEALIGAIYLDLGMECVQTFLQYILSSKLNLSQLLIDDNYKDILLRYVQKNGTIMPKFDIVEIRGVAHKPIFSILVTVELHGTIYTSSQESETKKNAEQLCSQDILRQLGLTTFHI